jgi:hypothetical protein
MQQYARNIPSPEQTGALADAVGRDSRRKWLLVDHGIVESTKSLQLSKKLGWTVHAALQGSDLAAFGMSGPHLNEIPELRSEKFFNSLAQWIALEPTAAGLSVICSNAEPPDLQAALNYLAMTTVDNDLRLHCRCADVRVLPNLLPLLHPRQARRVARTVGSWWWLDALGGTANWSGGEGVTGNAEEFDTGDHLQLDNTQFQRMLDASEPDIIFAMLLDKTSELVPKSDRGQFRVRLQRILDTATRFSVRQTPDRLQFVVLSLATGEAFHEHPGLAQTWRNIRERGASLGTEMQGWSQQLWLEIDHGRRPAQ